MGVGTSCAHEDFVAVVDVMRILNDVPEEEGGEVVYFTADVRIHCRGCGEPFGFRGVPCGVSMAAPMRSADALELRAPLLSPTDLALAGDLAGMCAP